MDAKKFDTIIDELLTIKRFKARVDLGHNSSAESNPIITIKSLPKACGDCGDMVTNRTVTYFVAYMGRPQECWLKRCGVCKKKEKFKKYSK